MDPQDDLLTALVSRESLARLDRYVSLLETWQKSQNLIGSSTRGDIRNRHVADSVQLLPLLPPGPCRILDIGSGAGFPGLPLAICRGDLSVYLVEGNAKKASFLREALRITGSSGGKVLNIRAESLTPSLIGGVPDVIVSRAAAPLWRLLDLGSRTAGPDTVYLLHKGQDVDAELTEATKYWRFGIIRHPSRVQNDSWILEVRHVTRAS
jgi:16S rRNA (guanine527-N7)-methyltransferase